jgi:homoserine O-acetyltransferase
MIALHRLSLTLLLLAAALPAAASELQFAELGECPLQGGAVIRDCRLGYREVKSAAGVQAPVIVFLTWFGGTSEQMIQYNNVGPGGLADSNRYRVILIDAFANGVSSSPSNSPQQGGGSFPQLTIADMVVAQHRLLTGVLGIKRVHAVMGVSMGGMQAFEWWARYPEFASRYLSIEGTPWMSSYDAVLWQTWVQAIDAYDGSPGSLAFTSELLAKLQLLTLWTPDYVVRTVSVEGLPAFLQNFTPPWQEGDLYNHRSQAQAMLAQDIRRTGLPASPPRLLAVVSNSDHVVIPGPSQELAAQVGSQAVVLDSDCGHLAMTGECAAQPLNVAVQAFLAAP